MNIKFLNNLNLYFYIKLILVILFINFFLLINETFAKEPEEVRKELDQIQKLFEDEVLTAEEYTAAATKALEQLDEYNSLKKLNDDGILEDSKFYEAINKLLGYETAEAEEVGEEEMIRRNQMSGLTMKQSKWIEWRFFASRLMFYFTAIVSNKCAVEEAIWGIEKDNFEYVFPLPECYYDDPYSSGDAEISIYIDEILEEDSDSLLGLDDESSKIDKIYVQITFYNGDVEKREFPINPKVLRHMEKCTAPLADGEERDISC